jgi:methionine-rich copper-binding protein CopC
MKQLITALVLSLSITAFLTAHPVITDNKPAKPAVDKRGGKYELVILPNPKTGSVLISFKAEKPGKGMVIVFDDTGNIVLKQQVKLAAGKNKININNFTNLEEGNYTVCLNTSHKIYSAPFLLWK